MGGDAHATDMTPKQAAAKLGRINTRLTGTDKGILTKLQDRVFKIAVQQTSGKVMQPELNRRGNPYGIGSTNPKGKSRGAAPYGDAGKVNAPTGALKAKWRKGVIYKDGAGEIHAPVTNTDSKAYLFDGQPHGKMRERPLEESILRRASKVIADAVTAAVNRAVR